MTVAFALLLDMAVKGSLLCLFGLLLSAALRRRSATLRHDLWLAVLTCCAVLPLAALLWRSLGPTPSVAPVHDAVMAVTSSLPAGTPAGAIEIVDRIWSGDGASPDLGRAAIVLLAVWLAGFAVAMLRLFASHRAAAAMSRRGWVFDCPLAPPRVRVLITPELTAPAVLGAASPIILLPLEAEHWSEARLRAVFAHEAAHIARRDCAIELLVQAAAALHWFNPLVLAAARRLRIERELACDERVVAAGFDSWGYASALVDVARHATARPQAALLAMARAPELERRVLVLLGPRRQAGRAGLRHGLAWAGALLFTGFGMLTAPMAGVLGAGSVQVADGPYGGLDDPMSEQVPLDYARLAPAAARVPAEGPEAAAIAGLKAQLAHERRGYGDLVRERTIWTLAQVRDGRLFEPLAERVGDRDWRVRAYAAWGLAATGDRRATQLLTAILGDPVWRVRAMAASALAERADPAAATAIMTALEDPAWQVRMGAIDYARRLGDPAVLRRLRPLLHDPHNGTRLRAEDALSRL